MSQVCILTDSTAQFPYPVFPGRGLVNVIPLHIQYKEQVYTNGEGLKASDLPISLKDEMGPKVIAPSVQEFEKMFAALGTRYTDIVAILHSSHLTPTIRNAQEAASSVQGHITIQVIDSQTTAVGLGLLVQEAARAAEEEVPSVEIERSIRNLVSRVYTLFCIEGLTYLQHLGELGAAQALVGEYLEVMPIYILDSGQLVPTQKARNNRHLVDIMHEFLYEFLDLEHIALLQGVPPFEQETRALRERITDDFGETPISEHTISATLATLLGPRTLGLFAMQYE